MAEIVGLVASSIAIIETAGKVASAVLTLKKLWDEIQDVPDTIRNLMTEIEVLEPILTAIEDDFKSTGAPLPNDRASQLALAYCRKAVEDLDDLVQNLTIKLDAVKRVRRVKVKFRVSLEKESLRRLQDRMQAAVRLLTLTQQTYLVALTKSQPEIILRRLESTPVISSCDPVEQSRQDDGKGVQLRKDGNTPIIEFRQSTTHARFTRTSSWRTAFGNVGWGHGKEDGNTLFGWMTRLEAPTWLSQRAWDLRIIHSTIGWQVNLQPYCVRPSSHPVFDYAEHGDTETLGALIRSGQASIHDIDEDGWSLLHFACYYSRVEMVQQLLLWGADITLNTRDDFSTPAHFAVAGITYLERDLLAWPGLDDVLSATGAYEDIEDIQPWKPGSHQGIKGDNKGNKMSQSVGFFEFFQPVFSPKHSELDICERLDYGRVQWNYEDDVLRHLLFDEGIATTEQIQALEKSGIGPLNLVAYGYCQNHNIYGHVRTLRTLVREMVGLGADLHFEQKPHALPRHMRGAEGYPFSTPFFGVLIPDNRYSYQYECSRNLKKQIKETMLCWLQDLQICGIDLEQYGKNEKKVFRKHKILRERWYPCDQWMQLSEFKYGPEPEDWLLEWDLMPEDYAGNFWCFVEEQLHNPDLPGAWVDYLPDNDREGVGYYDACGDPETPEPDTEDGVAK